ncbi:MAG: thiamine biosynthesis protein ThiS [Acidimicrobiales bacterium]|nr:MAG: thiamine biosynthesis protein ThiS [Acidimicrobiales bacterium]
MNGRPDGAGMGGGRVSLLVNGEEIEVSVGTTVDDIVRRIVASPTGVAVARNDEVVPKSLWEETVVSDGDRIEVLTPAQGG